MKVCYITGFAGLIGGYFTRECLKKGWQVMGIDKITYASNQILIEEFSEYPNFNFELRDINNLENLDDCDYLFNFAAESHVDNSINNNDLFIKSNINGVHHLLELVRNKAIFGRPKFVQMSTDECFGDILEGSHKETDLLKPSNPYASSKASADMLIQAWSRTYGIEYQIIRCTNNYGLNQFHEKLIPRTIKCLNLGKKLPLHNMGKPSRTWIHSEDTCDAIFTIVEKGNLNEIYNINGDLELTNIEVVNRIIENYLGTDQYNIRDYVDFSYNRPGQDIRYSLDDSKLRNLGWSPKKNFDLELNNIVKENKGKFKW